MNAMNEGTGDGIATLGQKTGVPKLSEEVTLSAAEQHIKQESAAVNRNAEKRNEIIRDGTLDPEIGIMLIASLGRFFPDATVARIGGLAGHPGKQMGPKGMNIGGAIGATAVSGGTLTFLPSTIQGLEQYMSIVGAAAGTPRLAAVTSAVSMLTLLAAAAAVPLKQRFGFMTRYRTQSVDAANVLEQVFDGGSQLTHIRTLAAEGKIDELKKACDETVARIVTGKENAEGAEVTVPSTIPKNTAAATTMVIAAFLIGIYGAAGIQSGRDVRQLFEDQARRQPQTAVKRALKPVETFKEFSGLTWENATFAKGADQYGDAFKRLGYNLQVIFGNVEDKTKPATPLQRK